MTNVDVRGVKSDLSDMIESFNEMALSLGDVIRLNKQRLIGKLIMTLFVISIMYIGININYPIKQDLCQDNKKCISTQESFMRLSIIIAMIVMGMLILYSYVKFYKTLHRLISYTIGQIRLPLIVFLLLPLVYYIHVIRRDNINLNTNRTMLIIVIMLSLVNLIAIISLSGFTIIVPIGKLFYFVIMLFLVFMWIPAIDYIFGVVDIGDDHKVSEQFSSGWYIIYPIAFLLSAYFVFFITLHLVLIGNLRKFF